MIDYQFISIEIGGKILTNDTLLRYYVLMLPTVPYLKLLGIVVCKMNEMPWPTMETLQSPTWKTSIY